MPKKLTQKELAELRARYLKQREELLQSKVSKLSVKLYDNVYENYLSALETSDGKLVYSDRNISMVQGLDRVYENFVISENIPVIKSFVVDLQKIVPLNERYFRNIEEKGISATAEQATKVVNKRLGVTAKGEVIPKGFVDKFIKDKDLIKSIKKKTTKALTNGQSFQEFRIELRDHIKGKPGVPNSGGVHQYYRNYAYDTYQKTDRLAGDTFAKELELNFFIWQGGVIQTSRAICVKCNSKVIDAREYKKIKYGDLKSVYQEGLPDGKNETWDPMNDLGGYGCRHSKDWITDGTAERLKDRQLNIKSLLDN